MTQTDLDPARQEKARAYEHKHQRLMLVDLGLGALYLAAWLFSGASIQLRSALTAITNNDWLLVALFILIFGGLYFILDLPLSYYGDYVLPKQYGQSIQTLSSWVKDQAIGLAVSTVLGLAIIEIIYYVLRIAPNNWWVWASAILLVFNVLIANLAPIIIYPLFYKFKQLGEEHQELVERLTNLARKSNTRVNGVYKFDMSKRTPAANAALTGLGNTRRIILGDTLINEFTLDEIETILAHELGHHVHNDIPIGIVMQTMLTLAGFYLANQGLLRGLFGFGFTGPSDPAAMPLFGLILGAFGLIILPLENAFSRWRERRADEYALQITHKKEAYASALTRLANQNLADADPEPWLEFLLYSHPALSRRIHMARSFTPRSE
jgi:STE24 endopeptidase